MGIKSTSIYNLDEIEGIKDAIQNKALNALEFNLNNLLNLKGWIDKELFSYSLTQQEYDDIKNHLVTEINIDIKEKIQKESISCLINLLEKYGRNYAYEVMQTINLFSDNTSLKTGYRHYIKDLKSRIK